MKTFYDVQQLLKKFGTFIYTKDRNFDIELMEDDLRELYQNQMISVDDFRLAMIILRSEKNK